jgi:hypothetical protein
MLHSIHQTRSYPNSTAITLGQSFISRELIMDKVQFASSTHSWSTRPVHPSASQPSDYMRIHQTRQLHSFRHDDSRGQRGTKCIALPDVDPEGANHLPLRPIPKVHMRVTKVPRRRLIFSQNHQVTASTRQRSYSFPPRHIHWLSAPKFAAMIDSLAYEVAMQDCQDQDWGRRPSCQESDD